MIFTIKQQDHRHKARLVAGGNVVDSSMYLTSYSMIQKLSVRCLFIIVVANNLEIMTTDIATAYLIAPNHEKVGSLTGPEF